MTHPKDGHGGPDGVWLAQAMSSELELLADTVGKLESAIGGWIEAAGLNPVAIQELQSTDLIGQTLRELAGVLDRYQALATLGRDGAVETSLETIRLGGLRARLIALRNGQEAPEEATSELELF